MNKHVTRFVSLVSITTLFIPSFLVFAEEIPSSINTNTTTVESVSPEATPDTTVQQVTPVVTTPLETPQTTSSTSGSTDSTPPPEAEATPTASASPSATDPNAQQSAQSNDTKLKIETDKATGALRYEYPIDIPKGRNNLTPQLSLKYNSQNTDNSSIAGYGWETSIPYIKRLNKYGVDKLYDPTTETFISSIDGELTLIDPLLHTYRPTKDGGDFHIYTYINNTWSFTDKSGTIYSFGTTAQSRQDDPSDPNRVYQWNIETVTDTNTNAVTYTYTKDQGQIYPSTISYAIFSVNFVLENRTSLLRSSTFGFPIVTSKRIGEVRVDENTTWRKKYTLTYINSDNGQDTLLGSITESAQDAQNNVTTLPPTTFDYTKSTSGWTYDPTFSATVPLTFTGDNSKDEGVRTADINGDGLVDFIKSLKNAYGVPVAEIYLNTGSGWQNASGIWSFPLDQEYLAASATSNRIETFVERSTTSGPYKPRDLQFMDVNGDGLSDLVRARRYASNNYKYVYLNNGSGWTYDPTFSATVPLTFTGDNSKDEGVRTADINGDGLVDFIKSLKNAYGVPVAEIYLNTGSGWQNASGIWSFPLDQEYLAASATSNRIETFVERSTTSGPYKPRDLQFMDVNGDGLSDLVRARRYASNNYKYVYLNNGSGWTYDPTFSATVPLTFTGDNSKDEGVRTADINGDGLVDFIKSLKNAYGVPVAEIYLNTGSGWQNASGIWSFPLDQEYLAASATSNRIETFVERSTTSGPYKPRDLQFMDVNGDGLSDLVRARRYASNNYKYVYLNNSNTIQNILSKITTPSGSETAVTYKSTPQFVSTPGTLLNPHVSSSRDIVSTLTTTDPVSNNASRLEYTYSGGEHFYAGPHDKEFAGFEKVEERVFDLGGGGVASAPGSGNLIRKTVTYYHQGDSDNTMPITNPSQSSFGETTDTRSKMGRPFRTEVYDGNGTLLQSDITRWASTQIAGASYFVYPSTTLSQTFDPTTSNHKDSATSYTYNTTTGDLNAQTNQGIVTGNNDGTFTDIGTDKYTIDYLYVSNATTGVNKFKKISIKNNAGVLESEKTYWYDGLTYGSITKGNVTKDNSWQSGPSMSASSIWATTQYAYNSYGMPITTTDPNGNTTTITYDTNNLYPLTVTNPLGHSTSYIYDATLGKPTKVTDPNGTVSEYTYDYFGRLLTEIINSELKTKNSYDDTPLHAFVKEEKYMSDTLSSVTYTYFDSFRRPIQKAIKKNSQAIKIDTVYDSLGNVTKQSVPYEMPEITNTPPYFNSGYFTSYTYDALGRVLTENHILGTITHAYTPWKETVTDREGKVKEYSTDAYGNLVQVIEHDGINLYTTNYAYDSNKNLTNMIDTLGNVRSFTYDGMRRRVSATDLHASSDTTFGTYTYTYDLNGNLTSMTQPGGNVVSYTYNALNQQLTEDSANTTGTDITYTYNTCTNGKGALCSATRTGVTTNYTYTPTGEIATSIVTIGSPMTTTYTYDRLGHVLTITNPDGITINNSYNDRGLIWKIDKTIGTTTTPVITTVEYIPTMAVKSISYPNGIQTINSYNPLSGYRLDKKTSYTPSGYVQELKYSYKPMGNIFKITDSSNPAVTKTTSYVYDDLYRLIKANLNTNTGTILYSENYSYNAIGNLLSKNGIPYQYVGNTGTLTTNPHAVTSIGTANRTYNVLGNVLTDGVHTNVWNYRNELVSTTKTGITSTYAYDHTGQRIKEVEGVNTTYTPTKTYTKEITGTTNKQTTTVYLGDTQVATLETVGSTTTPSYILTDHLGSTDKVTDATGVVTSTIEYYPYGAERTHTGTLPKRTFIGERADSSGYNYLNARYLNSSEGQFISQDPVFWTTEKQKEQLRDPQLWNSYSYSRGNPVMYKDQDGKFMEGWDKNTFSYTGAASEFYNEYIGNPAREFATNVANFIPGIGEIKSGYEALSGRDAITNATLSEGQQRLAVISAIPVIGMIGDAGKVVRAGDTISGLRVTTHAAEGITKRNIQQTQIGIAVDKGVKYLDTKTNNILHVIKEKGGNGYTIVTDKTQKTLVSVENFVRNLNPKNSPDRFKKIKSE